MINKVALYLIICCVSVFLVDAQVGINTTTPRGELEISSKVSGGGFLAPEYALSGNDDSTTVVNPQGGVIVAGTTIYNTATVTGVNAITPGLVSWNGTVWMSLISGSASGDFWETDGNAIISTDFLGTTNAQPLVFKVQNTTISQFKTDQTFHLGSGSSTAGLFSMAVGRNTMATGDQSVALGNGSEALNENVVAIGNNAKITGKNAIGIGNQNDADGENSISIGENAKAILGETIAIGNSALAQAENAIAIGNAVEANNDNSISIGNETITTGESAISIGVKAEASGKDAIALGNTTLAPNDNTIVLGSFHNIGIGTNDPQEKLHVNGGLRVTDGSQANGKIMVSDADGTTSWKTFNETADLAMAQVFINFSTHSPVADTALPFNQSPIEDGIVFNTTDRSLENTVIAGVYRVNYNLQIKRNDATTHMVDYYLTQDGTTVLDKIAGSGTQAQIESNEVSVLSKSFLISLPLNSKIYVVPAVTNNNVDILTDSSFSMELVKAN